LKWASKPMDLNTNIMPIIISVGVFLVVILSGISLQQYARLRTQRREVLDKVNQATSLPLTTVGSVGSKKGSWGSVRGILEKLGKHKDPNKSDEYTKIRIFFYRAGWYGPSVFAVFWGAKIFAACLLPVVFLACAFTFQLQLPPTYYLFVIISLVLLGLNVPNIWMKLKIRKRKDKIFKGFPDALDLLILCVEAGMGLDTAFHRVGIETALSHPELSKELKMYNVEIRTGKSRKNSLQNLTLRTDIPDVNNLVSLLLQADRFGTSVTDALRVYSDTFRTKRMQRAEEKAAMLPVKIIAVAMLFIFPVIYVVTLGPAILQAINLMSPR
jgi:tight adherence protein C